MTVTLDGVRFNARALIHLSYPRALLSMYVLVFLFFFSLGDSSCLPCSMDRISLANGTTQVRFTVHDLMVNGFFPSIVTHYSAIYFIFCCC